MYSPEGPYLHEMLTRLFRQAGVRPRYVQQMSRAQAILSLVSAGTGLAIVPEETSNAAFNTIVFRPLRLGQDFTVELHSVWHAHNRNRILPVFQGLLLRL